MTDPGQPWVNNSGIASGSGERATITWIGVPPIVVRYCGQALRRASVGRQS